MSELLSILSAEGKNINHTELKTIINHIRNGLYKFKIERIRELNRLGKIAEMETQIMSLPSFMPAGRFELTATTEYLSHYSELVALEIPYLPLGQRNFLHERIINESFTRACFLNPLGNTLIVLVQVEASKYAHAMIFDAVRQHYARLLGADISEKGRKIAHTCAYSYDPSAFYCENATAFRVLSRVQV